MDSDGEWHKMLRKKLWAKLSHFSISQHCRYDSDLLQYRGSIDQILSEKPGKTKKTPRQDPQMKWPNPGLFQWQIK